MLDTVPGAFTAKTFSKAGLLQLCSESSCLKEHFGCPEWLDYGVCVVCEAPLWWMALSGLTVSAASEGC